MRGRPSLFEPIHQVEVRIPEDCQGKVMGDISSQRGRILDIDADGLFQSINLKTATELTAGNVKNAEKAISVAVCEGFHSPGG